jgi:hypothetical protein
VGNYNAALPSCQPISQKFCAFFHKPCVKFSPGYTRHKKPFAKPEVSESLQKTSGAKGQILRKNCDEKRRWFYDSVVEKGWEPDKDYNEKAETVQGKMDFFFSLLVGTQVLAFQAISESKSMRHANFQKAFTSSCNSFIWWHFVVLINVCHHWVFFVLF